LWLPVSVAPVSDERGALRAEQQDEKGEKPVKDLIVVTYNNEYSAVENMAKLRRLNEDWVVDIHDAVAVARDTDGKLHIQDNYKPTTGQGAGWGVLLGTILGGLALVPFTGGLSAAAAAGTVAVGATGGATLGGLTGAIVAADEKDTSGVSEEFVAQVTDTIKRGQSALFALVESHDLERVAGYFRGTGGTIIRTNLSSEEQARAEQILAGKY
jgi:uncharacterized membrane protein